MASYNGVGKRFKNALLATLNDIRMPTDDGPVVPFTVKDSSRGAFEEYPGVRLLPADVGNEKASTQENERTLRFLILVILPMGSSAESESATYDQMYDLTDLILDAVDDADNDDVLNQHDSTLPSSMLSATRGDWYPVEENAGMMLVCDINVEVKYSRS